MLPIITLIEKTINKTVGKTTIEPKKEYFIALKIIKNAKIKKKIRKIK
ncbi:MAG: hypothetical protein Fur0024_3400 [Patescibacteria group bacterium]